MGREFIGWRDRVEGLEGGGSSVWLGVQENPKPEAR